MILKKANAVFGLLAIALLLAHAGYEGVSYIMFIYRLYQTGKRAS